MTQENKELLLKDLCARLPYGVKIKIGDDIDIMLELGVDTGWINASYDLDKVKPYLRPMSSMTEIEHMELKAAYDNGSNGLFDEYSHIDWLNAHYFDYRGLIEKSLALEAPEDMYK